MGAVTWITGGSSHSATVEVTTGRTRSSPFWRSTSPAMKSWAWGRSKYQLSTGRSSGVVPVSCDTGLMSSSGSNWCPRSHSSA